MSQIDEFKKNLSCSICLGKFCQPITLLCQHTFCKNCLVQSKENDCAICRVPYVIPNEINHVIDDATKAFFPEEYQVKFDELPEETAEELEAKKLRTGLYNQILKTLVKDSSGSIGPNEDFPKDPEENLIYKCSEIFGNVFGPTSPFSSPLILIKHQIVYTCRAAILSVVTCVTCILHLCGLTHPAGVSIVLLGAVFFTIYNTILWYYYNMSFVYIANVLARNGYILNADLTNVVRRINVRMPAPGRPGANAPLRVRETFTNIHDNEPEPIIARETIFQPGEFFRPDSPGPLTEQLNRQQNAQIVTNALSTMMEEVRRNPELLRQFADASAEINGMNLIVPPNIISAVSTQQNTNDILRDLLNRPDTPVVSENTPVASNQMPSMEEVE
jgi:RING-type zinc-finger